MESIVHVVEPPWDASEITPGAIQPVEPAVLTRQAPDAHLRLETGVLRGRCSLWWTQVPDWPAHRLGVIGHFSAIDEPAAQMLLAAACARLRAEGRTLAVGPMDGNTWRSYRLVTDPGRRPPFLLEPSNPPAWPEWWSRAGFRAFQTYHSSQLDDLTAVDSRLNEVQARLRATGVTWRPLRMEDFDDELNRIFEVSAAAFKRAVLYTPLPRAEFLVMYQQLRPLVREGLVWIAEHGHHPAGFIFAAPDLAQAQRGSPVDTVVAKTLAVLPGRAFAGLGMVLLEQVHRAARGMGMAHVIHALMHDANRSTLMGAGSSVIRRYTLFSKDLA